LAGLPENVLNRDVESGILADNRYIPRLDQIPKPALQRSADAELQCGGNLLASGLEDHAQQTCAKIGAIDSLTGGSEQDLLNHVANVILHCGVCGAPVEIEVKWIVEVSHDQVPVTRVCVDTIIKGVPVGAQMAWLSRRSKG